jgi:alpha-mannosidase
MPIALARIDATDIIRGEGEGAAQGIRLVVTGAAPEAAVTGGIQGGESVTATADAEGSAVLIAFADQPEAPPSAARRLAAVVESAGESARLEDDVRYAEPGWTLHLAPHFHYDPVWWAPQSTYVSEWENQPVAREARMLPEQHTAFDLMREHLDRAESDPDYCFVVAEIDYLKPWWDTFPAERARFRELLAAGRIEVTGGSYNEPSTTLISAEATIRNAISGSGFQRAVLGADPRVAWMLDVFGHDPHFPAIMADAGLTGSSWARGPFHEWGPMAGEFTSAIADKDPEMQFDAEFEWMAPSGKSLLMSFQPAHYHAAFWMDRETTVEAAETQIFDLFRHMTTSSATKHVFLLVGTDHTTPNKWVTEIKRHWAAQYTWPRFVVDTPSDYFRAVEADAAAGRGIITTQTRDMNPVFAGTAVSYIDTKLANRAAEMLLVEAEKFATLAWIRGLTPDYPEAEIDFAWRQLAFAAHHDAITGSESDQVYIDLLGMWRSAWSIARAVHDTATRALLSGRATTGDEQSVTVFNGMSNDRVDVVRLATEIQPDAVRDADGVVVPSAVSGDAATGWTVEFVAEVPATGYATFALGGASGGSAWADIPGTMIANTRFSLTVDAGRGGTVSSLRDLADDVELITAGAAGNEIVVYDEYPEHPRINGLGPWHITQKGAAVLRSSEDAVIESVRAQRSAVGERVIVTGVFDGMPFVQTLTLWAGVERVDAVTKLDFEGSDKLVRILWPCRIPGAMPVAQVAGAVIGRNIAHPDVDSKEFPWVMDSTCHEWFGLSAPVRLRVTDPADGAVRERAIAVAEIVSRDLAESAASGRELAQALVRCGVTSTNSLADGVRYGDLDKDSNQPDFRIAFGTPETSSLVAEVLASADPWFASEVARLAGGGGGSVLVPAAPDHDIHAPGATVAGARDLPVLIIVGDIAARVAAIAADLGDDAILEVAQSVRLLPAEHFESRSVAVLNRGIPGYAVDPAGTLYLSALKSSTGWPSGVWIDLPKRATPDGSGFQLQHWTHHFDYAIAAGAGDWRDAGIAVAGQAYNHPFTTVLGSGVADAAAGRSSLLRVDPPTVQAGALKRSGNPLSFAGDPGLTGGVTLRLAESSGRDAAATVSFGDLAPTSAHLSDLLERRTGAAVPAGDGLRLTVGGFDHETVHVGLGGDSAGSAAASATPAFSRYWLHNTGPAPLGNQPVAVRIQETGAATDGVLALDIQLASEIADAAAAGRLRVTVTGGGALTDAGEREIDPIGEVRLERVGVKLDGSGPVTVVAAFADGVSPEVYDVVAFDAQGARILAPEVSAAITTGWTADRYEVAPGGSVEVALEVRNSGGFDLIGDLILLTPWGSWTWIDDWERRIEVPAGEARTVRFAVTPPPGTDPATTWALVKIGVLGVPIYTETVPLVVTAG